MSSLQVHSSSSGSITTEDTTPESEPTLMTPEVTLSTVTLQDIEEETKEQDPDEGLPTTITGYFILKCKLAFRRSPKEKKKSKSIDASSIGTTDEKLVSGESGSNELSTSDSTKKSKEDGTKSDYNHHNHNNNDTTDEDALTRSEEDEEAYATFTYLALLTALYLPLLLFFWIRRSMFGAASLVRSLFLGHLLRLLLAFLLLPPSTTKSFIPTWMWNVCLKVGTNLESYQLEQRLLAWIPTWMLVVMDLILGNETGHHSRNINPSSALGGCISAFEKNKWPPPALIGLAIFTFIAIVVHPDGLTWIICRHIRDGAYAIVYNIIDGIHLFREGKIKIKLSTVSGTLATIFLVVIILQQIFNPKDDEARSNKPTPTQKMKHKHRKGKKGRGGRHHHNHHNGSGGGGSNGGKARIKNNGQSSKFSEGRSRSTSPLPRGRTESDMDDTIVSGMSDVNSTTTMNTTTTNLTSPLEKGSCKDRALESTTTAAIASNDVLKSSPSKSERYEKDVSPILTTTPTTIHNDSRRLQTHKEDKISISSSPSTCQKAASVSVSSMDKEIHDVSGTTKGRGRRKKRGQKKSPRTKMEKRNDEDSDVVSVNTIDYPPSNGPLEHTATHHPQHPKQKKKKQSRKEKERQSYSTPYSAPSTSSNVQEEPAKPISVARSVTPETELSYLNHSYVKEVKEESDTASYQTESTVGLHDQPSHLSLDQPSPHLSLEPQQSHVSPLSSSNGNHSLFSSPLTLGGSERMNTTTVTSSNNLLSNVNVQSARLMQYNAPTSNINAVSYNNDTHHHHHNQQYNSTGKAELAAFLSRVGIIGTTCANLLMDIADIDALERFTDEDYCLYSIHPSKRVEIMTVLQERRKRQFLKRQYYEEQQQLQQVQQQQQLEANMLGSWNQGGLIRPPPGLALSQAHDNTAAATTTSAVGTSSSQSMNMYRNENKITHQNHVPSSTNRNMYADENKLIHNHDHSVPSLTSSSNYSSTYSELSSSIFVREQSFQTDPYYSLGSMPQCQGTNASGGGGRGGNSVGIGATSNVVQREVSNHNARMSSLPSLSHNRAPGSSSARTRSSNMMGSSNSRTTSSSSSSRVIGINRVVGNNDAEIEANLQELGGQMAGSILDF